MDNVVLNETYAIMIDGDKKLYWTDKIPEGKGCWTEDLRYITTFDIKPQVLYDCLCKWHPRKNIKIVKVRTVAGKINA